MICYICDENNWHERPDLNPERLLKICKTCGNVAYHVEPDEEAKVLEYYRKSYRAAPTLGNIITSVHKLLYVRQFLQEYLKDKKGLVCGDVGSAIGYIPGFLRSLGHKATGCELGLLYRRFSEHFYGVPLTEELDDSRKYDLITIYHVLEHLIEPDKKLAKFVSMLKDDGRMMISTPEWFNRLEESSGSDLTSFTHLFHKDHINVFSATSLQNLFRKAGLVVEKENRVTYGQTYLLRKATKEEMERAEWYAELDATTNKPTSTRTWAREEWEVRNQQLDKAKAAIEAVVQKRYTDALAIWPQCPDAYRFLVFDTHMKNPEEQERIFKEGFQIMPDSSRLHLFYGIWLYQRQRWADAMKEWDWLMEFRPSEDVMMHMGWCHAAMGAPKEAMRWINKAAEVNPAKWSEAMAWLCQQASNIPAWDEVAMERIKNQMIEKAAPVVKLNDPAMADTPPKAKLEVV